MLRNQQSAPPVTDITIDRDLVVQLQQFTAGSNDEWGGLVIGFEDNGVPVYTLAAFPPQLAQSPVCCVFETRYRLALQIGLETAGLSAVLPRIDWIHTHPGYGVYLSLIDKVTYTAYRREDPDITALVYDPESNDLGWFAQPVCPPVLVRQRAVALPPLVAEGVIAAHAILRLIGVTHIFHAGSDAERDLRTVRAQTQVALANIQRDQFQHTIHAVHTAESSRCKT